MKPTVLTSERLFKPERGEFSQCRQNGWFHLFWIVLCYTMASCAQAQFYRCLTESGQIVLQDTPCHYRQNLFYLEDSNQQKSEKPVQIQKSRKQKKQLRKIQSLTKNLKKENQKRANEQKRQLKKTARQKKIKQNQAYQCEVVLLKIQQTEKSLKLSRNTVKHKKALHDQLALLALKKAKVCQR